MANQPILYDPHGREVSASAYSTGPVRRRGAQKEGTLSNWMVQRLSRLAESQEREELTDRAQDLAVNDPHAASVIDSMSTNVVGTGLNPQAKPRYKRLCISEEAADELAEQQEWAWQKWTPQADAGQRLHFNDMQFLAIYGMLMAGEYLHIPFMKKGRSRPGESPVRLRLKAISPLRMATPSDLLSDTFVRDGIRLGQDGEAVTYYIADPNDGVLQYGLDSSQFKDYPAWRGHRPGVLHSFHNAAKDPDAVRGTSILNPAMKFFKDLGDGLDFELVGMIMASSIAVWIDESDPYSQTQDFPSSDPRNKDKTKFQEVEPGQYYYGRGKPHILKSERPSTTFQGFVQTILRAIGASVGLPYEVVAKDFSQTSYSSAKAALLEAWRVYRFYRTWLERHYCQRVWRMVQEEAWLRGEVDLPRGGPDFYQALDEYTNAVWIGPPRGYIEPVKEVTANIKRLQNNMTTLAEIRAEDGGEWASTVEQRAKEKRTIGSYPELTNQSENDNAKPV